MEGVSQFSPEGVGAPFSFKVGGENFAFEGGFTEGEFTGMIRAADGKEFAGLVQDLGGGRYRVRDWDGDRVIESPAEAVAEAAVAAVEAPAVRVEDAMAVAAVEPTVVPEPAAAAVAEVPQPAPEPIPAVPAPQPEARIEAKAAAEPIKKIQETRGKIQQIAEESRAGREVKVAEVDQAAVEAIKGFNQQTKIMLAERQRDLHRLSGILSAEGAERETIAKGSKFRGLTLPKMEELKSQLELEIESITAAREEQKRKIAEELGVELDAQGQPLPPAAEQASQEGLSAENVAVWHKAIDEEADVALTNLQKWEDYVSGVNNPEAQMANLSTQVEGISSQMENVLRRARRVKGQPGTYRLSQKDQAEYDNLRKQQQSLRRRISKLNATRPAEIRGESVRWGVGIQPGDRRVEGPRTEIGLMYEDAIREIQGGAPTAGEEVVPLAAEIPSQPVEAPAPPEVVTTPAAEPEVAESETAPVVAPAPPVELTPEAEPEIEIEAPVAEPEAAPAEAVKEPAAELAPEEIRERAERRKNNFADAVAQLEGAYLDTSGNQAERVGRVVERVRALVLAGLELAEEGGAAQEVVVNVLGRLNNDPNRRLVQAAVGGAPEQVNQAVRNTLEARGAFGPDGKPKSRKELEEAGIVGLIELLLQLGMSFTDASVNAVISEVQSATGAGR